MKKLIQGDSLKYFKENKIGKVKLLLTSPSYFTDVSKKDSIDGEIGYGSPKDEYVKLISEVISDVSKSMEVDSKIVLVLGRYNDLPIESIILMLEDSLLESDIHLCEYSLHGKGSHESIIVLNKGRKVQIAIPTFYKLQIYDKVGFFGRINGDILEWAINAFTEKSDLVVDPFAGAGSTINKADQLGRDGLGVEINHKFIK